MIARISRLRRLSWRERLILAEALVMLGLARLALIILPFRRLASHLARPLVDGKRGDLGEARRVGVALHHAARVTPWRSKCLEQAVAGQWMLRRRGLRGTLSLGVAKEGEVMEAHAWLRCGEQIVTGGQEVARYGVVARFGDHGP